MASSKAETRSKQRKLVKNSVETDGLYFLSTVSKVKVKVTPHRPRRPREGVEV